jgi:heme/copper-type cytochrome/quinol oxidase subunit 2
VKTTVLWICGAVAAMVFIALIHSIVTFKNATDLPAKKHSRVSEILWAIVPIIMLVAMAVPAVKSLVAPSSSSQLAAER